ncbi:MAG: bifunctional riboflavin kinase/FAD synthetase [Deltaproteobacteria bacterium]|nr:bifunctional riboflavin kinase/FAD synthetase [Deltaproteobacteria bacterium]MCL5880860.1 bifunctional riboflavin kinase/FAD synthetase [Deltaproteobacteria bacterium]MDA8303756.1 bifunctional riboflavin kinase/FAD synthetase [Deltaproteobacteria bacterium]
MKISEISKFNPEFISSVITIGSFDGIHLGHRKLMELTKDYALKLNLPSVVLTFHPHPLKILHPEEKVHLITTFEKKIELIEAIGIDYLIYITFTPEFARMSPEDFIENIIVKKLNPVKVIVGHDFGFGVGKSGNTLLLEKLANKLHFELTVVGPVKMGKKIVSSTIIRRFVLLGQVCAVKRFLGRHYSVHGKVVKGSGRGKNLGFPTANIIPEEELFPKDGVYATLVKVDNEFHDSVTNVGSNPTFNEELRRIETYIFNFDKDLYGKEIEVFFVARIRPEIKFDNPASLENRIKKDIALATVILSKEHAAPI